MRRGRILGYGYFSCDLWMGFQEVEVGVGEGEEEVQKWIEGGREGATGIEGEEKVDRDSLVDFDSDNLD